MAIAVIGTYKGLDSRLFFQLTNRESSVRESDSSIPFSYLGFDCLIVSTLPEYSVEVMILSLRIRSSADE